MFVVYDDTLASWSNPPRRANQSIVYILVFLFAQIIANEILLVCAIVQIVEITPDRPKYNFLTGL